jgi:membrane-associated phospholipid phosphatase
MPKVLMILIWPAGLAVIIGIGALLASRVCDPVSHPLAHYNGRRGAGRRAAVRGCERLLSGRSAITRFFVTLLAGVAVVYLCGVVIGLIAVHGGPSIDKPIWHWTVSHQVHGWVSVMKKATQTAATFTVLGAAVTAAVCLVFVWQRDRWLPPVALATLIVADHYLTMALTDTFNRAPPPHSGGTFPSGASDRAVVYYGLIAFFLWRVVSGRRKAAIWAGTVVASLAFTEGYSRGYLALHWFTDIVSGLLYGTLLLTACILAVKATTSDRAADYNIRSAAGHASRAPAARAHVPDPPFPPAPFPGGPVPTVPGAGVPVTGVPVTGATVTGATVTGATVTGVQSQPGRPYAPGRHAAGEGVA